MPEQGLNRMEAKPISYEDRYRLLEEHMREAVIAADLNLTITYCSPSIESLSGRIPDDLLGASLSRLLSLESLNAITAASVRMPEDTTHKAVTVELRRPDGTFIPVNARLYVKPNRDPKIVMVLRDGHSLDDRILFETIEKCRLVFETSNEPVFVVNSHGRLMDMNNRWTEVFLYPKDEVIGLKLRMFFPKELEALLVYNAQKPLISWEGNLTSKEGNRLSCHVQAALWRGREGEVLGHIARVFNINRQE